MGLEKERSISYLRHLGGWLPARRRRFRDTFHKKPAPTLVRWSFLNFQPPLTPFCTGCKRKKKTKRITSFRKERFKLIVQRIYVRLVCKYIMKNSETLSFSSFLSSRSGICPASTQSSPQTIPPKQVLINNFMFHCRIEWLASQKALTWQRTRWCLDSSVRPQDHHPSFGCSAAYKLILQILY